MCQFSTAAVHSVLRISVCTNIFCWSEDNLKFSFRLNSASCRRPIKGAAGRPLELGDFRMEESFTSKYVPKYVPLADVKSEKTKRGRSIPMWIKMLLFVVVAVFLFLVYQAMETNQGNPFSRFLPESKTSN